MSVPRRHTELAERAVAVLRANDLGDWTKAAPILYWHHWTATAALDCPVPHAWA